MSESICVCCDELLNVQNMIETKGKLVCYECYKLERIEKQNNWNLLVQNQVPILNSQIALLQNSNVLNVDETKEIINIMFNSISSLRYEVMN